MKLTIERSELLKSLAHVQSVVERRTTIPILSNVRIGAGEDGLGLTATDMDIAIVETATAKVSQGGTTTAPAHTLYDIVRKLPDGSEIQISQDGEKGQLHLQAGRSKFRLACLPVGDFPSLSAGDLPHKFTIPAADLRSLIDRTRFAISTEETRYYLNGIYLHAAETEDGKPALRAVATDGHRLARVDAALPDGAADMPGIIIPRKTVGELRKLIEDTDGEVEVALSDIKISFAFDHVVLTSKLIDGTFPDYNRVIPPDNDKILELDCKLFAEAVDRVATISTEKSRAVKLAVQPKGLTISATSPENGTASEELEVSYESDAIEIGFNSRYLLDIAQQIDANGAQFAMADAASPTVVRDLSDPGALYVLMPMRV